MCTGMLLNFHTVTRCPWRFAVRSSTEPHNSQNSDRERSPRGVPALPGASGYPTRRLATRDSNPRGGRRRVVLRPPLYRLYSLLRFMCTARNDATPAGTIDPYARGPPAPAVRGSSCGFDAIRQGRRGRCLRSEVPRSSRRDKTSEDRRSAERSRGGTRRGSGF